MMNKSLRAGERESSRMRFYGFHGARATAGARKKRAAVSGGF
jgi:hypothetical protein